MPPTDVEETATLPLEGFDSVGQGRAVQQNVGNYMKQSNIGEYKFTYKNV